VEKQKTKESALQIGELMMALPKRQGFASTISDSGVQNTKTQAIEQAGFSYKQAQRFEQLASNPELVERAKAEARISSHGSPYKTS